MLSSAVVTVLAPQWSGRLRRSKRVEGAGYSQAQANLEDVPSNEANHVEQHFPGAHTQTMFAENSQLRVPFLNTRRNTVGWSSKSGPASFDCDSKRRVVQSVSLDVKSGRIDSQKNDAETFRSFRTSASPICPLSPDSNELRRVPQAGHQGGLHYLRSKPTSSSLLLSLRKFNSASRHANVTPVLPDINPSPSQQDVKLFSPESSQTFQNNNAKEKFSPLLLSTVSYRTTDTGPVCSNHRQREHSEMQRSPSSPVGEAIEDDPAFAPSSQRLNQTKSCFSYSRQVTLSSPPPEKLQNWGSSNINANVFPDGSISPGLPPYDPSVLRKTSSPSRSLDLSNSSRWKHICQEGPSLPALDNVINIKNKPCALSVQPCNNIRDVPTPSPTSNMRFSSLISKDGDNNNTKEFISKAKMSLVIKTQEGTHNFKENKAHGQESGRCFKHSCGTSTNNGEQLRPQSLPDFASTTKLSRPTTQTALIHPNDPPKNMITCPSFQSNQVSSQSNVPGSSRTLKCPNSVTTAPLGFERSYTSVPVPLRAHAVSSLSTTVNTIQNTNYNVASAPGTITAKSNPTPSVPPAIKLHLLTPPTTPDITGTVCRESDSPGEERKFSNSLERESKKPCLPGEGRRIRRVTWDDSVDRRSEPVAAKKPDPSEDLASPLSPSRRSIRAPSIFSFLRSSSATANTAPLCNTSPKTFPAQDEKGAKYRSLSSDCAELASTDWHRAQEKAMFFDKGKGNSAARHERTLSAESGTAQCHPSDQRSLCPDFSSGYKLRYSSPPYSTLKSTRSTHAEGKNVIPRSALFKSQCQSLYTPQFSSRTYPVSESRSDQVNNNLCRNIIQKCQNGQILFVNNRVHVESEVLKEENSHVSSSKCVTETLVYSIKSKARTVPLKNTRHEPFKETASTQLSGQKLALTAECQGSKSEPLGYSNPSSSGSSSTDAQSLDGESCNRRIKGIVMGKSRFFSVENNNEQSPKRGRFVMRKSLSTPSSTLSRSESEKAYKPNKKMDQVLNKLKQTFSTKRSDDELAFPWKWKRGSHAPSVSGSSDNSNTSDATTDISKTLGEHKPEREGVVKAKGRETEDTDNWTHGRYNLKPSAVAENSSAKDMFFIWPGKLNPETTQEQKNAFAEQFSEVKTQAHLTTQSPQKPQCEFYKDVQSDCKQTNQFLSCRDPSPNRPGAYSNNFRKSTPSPRSPFSPFSSLSPLSPFSSPDVTDDSVFYSPKLQRRRESFSPCDPGEGVSLASSRRSRVSVCSAISGPGLDKERAATTYADLKYGIEPGRSFSVSSVLSSRPSGPGRISTGTRFMSVGDLSQAGLTYGAPAKETDQRSVTPDWTPEYASRPNSDCDMSYITSDRSKLRSRSLPRSLSRCSENWSSMVSSPPLVSAATSKPTRLWSPKMNVCHIAWDTAGPPTPPPTPPLSPASVPAYKSPNMSSPMYPSRAGDSQESQSSRGRLPSRGYVSSLSTFEESSDSSSDTTTDDEYYLETGEDDEKETEL